MAYPINFFEINMRTFDFLEFNSEQKNRLFYCLKKEISKYHKIDEVNDILQNICIGLIENATKGKYTKNKIEYNYTFTINYKNKKEIKNPNLIRLLIKEMNFIYIKNNLGLLEKILSNITSDIYGVRSTNQSDFFSQRSGHKKEELNYDDEIFKGFRDNNSFLESRIKNIVESFLKTLTTEEYEIFMKYYVEDFSFRTLTNEEHVSQFHLRKLIKKTQEFFFEQLLD